jgi:hypothetical protein
MAKKKNGKPAKKKQKPARAVKAKRPAKKTAPKASSAAVRSVSTGRGTSAAELGIQLVAAFNQGKGDEWIHGVWSSDIVSVEGGANTEWVGRKSVLAKAEEWFKQNTLLGGAAEGPYVGATGFAVKFHIHIRDNATGAEMRAEEVGVYTVRDGKIIREEFMQRS